MHEEQVDVVRTVVRAPHQQRVRRSHNEHAFADLADDLEVVAVNDGFRVAVGLSNFFDQWHLSSLGIDQLGAVFASFHEEGGTVIHKRHVWDV